jgi:hypothetical protein
MYSTEARRYLNTDQAAAYCGSTRSTFEKLRHLGGSAPYLKVGRRVVYDIADLDLWLASKRRRSTSDRGTEAA